MVIGHEMPVPGTKVRPAPVLEMVEQRREDTVGWEGAVGFGEGPEEVP